ITIIECPAILNIRTTKDKKFLRITKFMPDHDHEPDAPPRLQMYLEMVKKSVSPGGVRKKDTQTFPTQPATLAKNALEIFNEQDQDLSDNIHVLPLQETASSLEVYNDFVNPAIISEDNFNELLKKLQVNIEASTNEEEKNNKLRQVNKMLVFFNKDLIQCHFQSRDEGISSKLNDGSLKIHSGRSRRRRDKGRQLRPIGLPLRKMSSNSKTFENRKTPAQSVMFLSMIISERSLINDIVLGRKKISENDLKHLESTNISDALASTLITNDLIEKFFEPNAFVVYQKIIENKLVSNNWTCKECQRKLENNNSIECDLCLYWYHWNCVGVTEEIVTEWLCPKCLN
ncbi:GSCOCG00009894001-RA-CDS, partial [Cotesia congregata]